MVVVLGMLKSPILMVGDRRRRGSPGPRQLLTPYTTTMRGFLVLTLIRLSYLELFVPNRHTPAHQVRILLENIKFTTPEFAVIKSHVRANYRSDLQGAITYISREVSEIFPATVPGQRGPFHFRIRLSTAATDESPSKFCWTQS